MGHVTASIFFYQGLKQRAPATVFVNISTAFGVTAVTFKYHADMHVQKYTRLSKFWS